MENDKSLGMIPNYELSTDEAGSNIYETSYVFNPATDKSMLYFNDESKKSNLGFAKPTVEGWQRITSGVFMMPDTKYIRVDKDGNYYTVSFSKESLYNALIKYLKAGNSDNVKVEHNGQLLEGFVAIEHWIIKDAKTISPVLGLSLKDMGYNPQDIPVGTVMKSTYIADEQFWNDMILTGKVTGYSLGGLFELTEFDFSKEVNKFYSNDITERFKSAYGESFSNADGIVLSIEDNAVKSNLESFNSNDGVFYLDVDSKLTKCVVKNGKIVEFSDEDEDKIKDTAMEAGMIFSKVCIKIEVEIEECDDEVENGENIVTDESLTNGTEVYVVDLRQTDSFANDVQLCCTTVVNDNVEKQLFVNTDNAKSNGEYIDSKVTESTQSNDLESFKNEMLAKMNEMSANFVSIQSKYETMLNEMRVLLLQSEVLLQEKDKTVKDTEKQIANVIKQTESQPIAKPQSFNKVEEVKPKGFPVKVGNTIVYVD